DLSAAFRKPASLARPRTKAWLACPRRLRTLARRTPERLRCPTDTSRGFADATRFVDVGANDQGDRATGDPRRSGRTELGHSSLSRLEVVSMDEIKGIARVKIHPGKLDEWKRLTEQAMEIVRTRDTGTLQYEVFFNDDESEAIVFERYQDADAALEHFANIGHLMEPLMATATVTGEVLGTPNETMRAQLGDGEPKPLHPVDGRTRLDDTTPHPQRRERAPLDSDLQVNRQSSSAMRLAARNRPTDSACPRGAAGAA